MEIAQSVPPARPQKWTAGIQSLRGFLHAATSVDCLSYANKIREPWSMNFAEMDKSPRS